MAERDHQLGIPIKPANLYSFSWVITLSHLHSKSCWSNHPEENLSQILGSLELYISLSSWRYSANKYQLGNVQILGLSPFLGAVSNHPEKFEMMRNN